MNEQYPARNYGGIVKLIRATLCVLAIVVVAMVAPPGAAAGRCGAHPWCDTSLPPERRADLLVAAMSVDEKLDLLAGDERLFPLRELNSYTTDRYAHARGIPRLGIPTVYFADGPVGVNRDRATLLPAPVLLAATFDPSAARAYGDTLADEVKRTGHDVSLSPAVDIVRTPLAGRAFEMYGEDPYLSSETAVAFIRGLQDAGVPATIKHYALNNQEGQDGVPGLPIAGTRGGRFTVNATVDDRTFHEIYLPMYDAAISDAHVASVMCAYNRISGLKACQNPALIDGILRGELGFDGFVVTDFNAALYDTAAGLNAGTDLEMPWTFAYRPALVQAVVAAGAVGAERVDRAVRHVLRTYFEFGIFDRAAHRNDRSSIDVAGHARRAGEIARGGIVLLRNAERLLPLADDARIAVIGESANRPVKGAGSGNVEPFLYETPLAGIRSRARGRVIYDDGSNVARAASAARQADVAIVFGVQASQEGSDLRCMRLDCDGRQDALIDAVAKANPRSVVVLQTGSAVEMPWLEQSRAVVEAWYAGADAGGALAAVLFGDSDPGGRLPVTFPKRVADTPTADNDRRYPGVGEEVHYSEGIFVGYRHYEERAIAPLFPFGFGLSYTTFHYRNLRVGRRLPDGTVHVGVTIRNAGRRTGSDVVQVYVGKPDSADLPQAPRSLAAYRKLTLRPGRARRVRLRIDARRFASWDAAGKRWRIVPGCHRLMVGRSSRDILLEGEITQPGRARCRVRRSSEH